jgi:ankyrin repeat protein
MNIYQTDSTKTPEIFTLIKEHKNEEAKQYLERNPMDVHLKGWMDDTPLHIASLSGNVELVKFLVAKGAEVNAERSGIYATPLCWAENYEIAKFLLDNGATMNDRELLVATSMNRVDVVDLLLTSGAKIDQLKPQYLGCNSIDCIQVYLNHGIKINGFDDRQSTLLHNLAWNELLAVFDFAYKNGCPWQKDSSRRNPYDLARQGNRTEFLKHIEAHYPELIVHKIEQISVPDYEFERISFFRQNTTNPDWYIALTKNAKLIKYILDGGELKIERIVSIDVSHIRNFTFDKNNNIIVPTADNKLLAVDPGTFHLIETISLPEDLVLDQIEYLPLKNIFIGSSDKRRIVLLSDDFRVISTTKAEDGTFFPKINHNESLISFMSYDQTTYYDLYSIKSDLSVNFIHTFFKDWDNASSGFDFNRDEFAVSFPNEIEYYSLDYEQLNKMWHLDISKYPSEHGLSYLVFWGEKSILLGKGKMLLFIDMQEKKIYKELELDLRAELRDLYLDKEQQNLFLSTDKELKLLQLNPFQ